MEETERLEGSDKDLVRPSNGLSDLGVILEKIPSNDRSVIVDEYDSLSNAVLTWF